MQFVLHGERPHYVQVGVVHGGIGECGSRSFPGIYARLEDEGNLNFVRQAIGLGKYRLASQDAKFNLVADL